MKVEVLILLFIAFMFVAWSIWYRWSTKRLLKKYNPKNDKSRKGKELRGKELEKGIEETETTERSVPRSSEPSEQVVLSTTATNTAGKNSKRPRGFFNRFRRRK